MLLIGTITFWVVVGVITWELCWQAKQGNLFSKNHNDVYKALMGTED